MSSTNSLTVRVFDEVRAPFMNAEVEVNGQKIEPSPKSGLHEAKGLKLGTVRIRVFAEGLQEEIRDIDIVRGRNDAVVILGRVGQLFYRRSGARVPFDPPNELVGVTLRKASPRSSRCGIENGRQAGQCGQGHRDVGAANDAPPK